MHPDIRLPRKPCCHARLRSREFAESNDRSFSGAPDEIAQAMAARRCRAWPLAPAALAQVTVSGVKYDETADVRGTKLQLNGAGVRYKAVFKVYTAGPLPDQECRHHRRGAGRARRQAHVHHHAARHRFRRTRQAVLARRGRQHGQGGLLQADPRRDAHEPDLLRPQEAQARRDLHHRLGSRHRHRDHGQGRAAGRALQGAEFYNALLRIWLGPNPADWKLKEALLGKPA